jgi:hypothetical protein
MVKPCDEYTLPGAARDGWIEGRLQEQFGLLECSQMPKVLRDLKCDPLVERELWFPGRPRGKDEPRTSAFHEGASREQGDAGGTCKTLVEWPVLVTCHSNPEQPPYAPQTAPRPV